MQPEIPIEEKITRDHQPKQLTPVQEWDQVAFALIYKELAPNGFKKILNGRKEVSAQQFLRKETVKRCQNISAQLIRAFREQTKLKIEDVIKFYDGNVKEYNADLAKCQFYQIAKKNRLKRYIHENLYAAQALKDLKNDLNQIEIPRKK